MAVTATFMKCLATCAALLAATPAGADTSYDIHISNPVHGDFGVADGTIVTDGALGALVPSDILSWSFTITVYDYPPIGGCTAVCAVSTHSYNSVTGTLSFAPDGLVGTPTEIDGQFHYTGAHELLGETRYGSSANGFN